MRTDGLSFISISEFSTCNYKYSNCVLNLDDFERLTNINVTKNKNILRERDVIGANDFYQCPTFNAKITLFL